MAKIVAVDTDFEDNNLEEAMARDAGIEFEVTRGRTAQAVINGLLETGADAAVTSYAMFPREVFEACPNLKAVSRTGVGYDEIDVEAATEYGVAVCNVPVTVRKWCLITPLRWRFRFCAGSTSLMPICAAACGIMHARARSGSAAVACSASSAWVKSAERRPRKLLVWALRWCAGRVA